MIKKDNPTIHKFNCRICDKYEEMQSIYDLFDEICTDCWLKEHNKESEDNNVRR